MSDTEKDQDSEVEHLGDDTIIDEPSAEEDDSKLEVVDLTPGGYESESSEQESSSSDGQDWDAFSEN